MKTNTNMKDNSRAVDMVQESHTHNVNAGEGTETVLNLSKKVVKHENPIPGSIGLSPDVHCEKEAPAVVVKSESPTKPSQQNLSIKISSVESLASAARSSVAKFDEKYIKILKRKSVASTTETPSTKHRIVSVPTPPKNRIVSASTTPTKPKPATDHEDTKPGIVYITPKNMTKTSTVPATSAPLKIAPKPGTLPTVSTLPANPFQFNKPRVPSLQGVTVSQGVPAAQGSPAAEGVSASAVQRHPTLFDDRGLTIKPPPPTKTYHYLKPGIIEKLKQACKGKIPGSQISIKISEIGKVDYTLIVKVPKECEMPVIVSPPQTDTAMRSDEPTTTVVDMSGNVVSSVLDSQTKSNSKRAVGKGKSKSEVTVGPIKEELIEVQETSTVPATSAPLKLAPKPGKLQGVSTLPANPFQFNKPRVPSLQGVTVSQGVPSAQGSPATEGVSASEVQRHPTLFDEPGLTIKPPTKTMVVKPEIIEKLKQACKGKTPGSQISIKISEIGKVDYTLIVKVPKESEMPVIVSPPHTDTNTTTDEPTTTVVDMSGNVVSSVLDSQTKNNSKRAVGKGESKSEVTVGPLKEEVIEVQETKPKKKKLVVEPIVTKPQEPLFKHHHPAADGFHADCAVCLVTEARKFRTGLGGSDSARKEAWKYRKPAAAIRNSCALLYCGSNILTPGVTLLPFPTDQTLCGKWFDNCQSMHVRKMNPLHLRLCCKHFEKSQLLGTEGTAQELVPNALPTQFSRGSYPLRWSLSDEGLMANIDGIIDPGVDWPALCAKKANSRITGAQPSDGRQPIKTSSDYCIYPSCGYSRKTAERKMTVLPASPHRVQQWLDIMGLAPKDGVNYRSLYVCKMHFAADQYNHPGSKTMVWNAVPLYPRGRDPSKLDDLNEWSTLVCSYPGCYTMRHEAIHMHKFPLDSSDEWLCAIGRQRPMRGHITDYRLCTKHFKPSDYQNGQMPQQAQGSSLKEEASPVQCMDTIPTLPTYAMGKDGRVLPMNDSAKLLPASATATIKQMIDQTRRIAPKPATGSTTETVTDQADIQIPEVEGELPIMEMVTKQKIINAQPKVVLERMIVHRPGKKSSKQDIPTTVNTPPEWTFTSEHAYRRKDSPNCVSKSDQLAAAAVRKEMLTMKKDMSRKLYSLNKRFNRLKSKHDLQTAHLKKVQDGITEEKFMKHITTYFQPPLSDLLVQHLKVKDKSLARGGYRYSEEVKKFAISVFRASPRVYDMLDKVISLPGRKTLQVNIRKMMMEEWKRENQNVQRSGGDDVEIDYSTFKITTEKTSGIQLPKIDAKELASKLSSLF